MNFRRHMRSLALMLLFAANLVRAQETRIISFTPPAMLTWTNSQTNTYYGIDYRWNPDYEWTSVWGPTYPFLSTAIVSSIDLGLMLPQLTTIWAAFGLTEESLFYRIVSSDKPLTPRFLTNEITIVNASTSVLVGVTLGVQTNGGGRYRSITLGDLAPGANTGHQPCFMQWPYSGPMSCSPDGVFFHFTQAGTVQDHVVEFMPWGPPHKRVTITVSNDSYSVEYEWLNLGGTYYYPSGNATDSSNTGNRLIVHIGEDACRINDVPCSIDSVSAILKQVAQQDPTVAVRVTWWEGATQMDVFQIMALCAKQGLTRVEAIGCSE